MAYSPDQSDICCLERRWLSPIKAIAPRSTMKDPPLRADNLLGYVSQKCRYVLKLTFYFFRSYKRNYFAAFIYDWHHYIFCIY